MKGIQYSRHSFPPNFFSKESEYDSIWDLYNPVLYSQDTIRVFTYRRPISNWYWNVNVVLSRFLKTIQSLSFRSNGTGVFGLPNGDNPDQLSKKLQFVVL